MPDILHRITIDAPAERVRDLLITTDGVGRWWTGRPVERDEQDRFAFYFGDAASPAAVARVDTDTDADVVWHIEAGPESWVGTDVTFRLRADGDVTTLLFAHTGWREQSEFMSGCSTNWGAYLTSLKHGVEDGRFAAYPASEISRWS